MVTLSTNERVLGSINKHWMFFFWPLIFSVFFGYLFIPVIWLIYRIARYFCDEIILTNQKVHISRGIISKEAYSCPLSAINSVQYSQGVLGRLFGYGTIHIQTAAFDAGNGYSYISHPEYVKSMIEAALENIHDDRNKRLAGYIGDEIKK